MCTEIFAVEEEAIPARYGAQSGDEAPYLGDWRGIMQQHTINSTKETVRSGFLDPSATPAATVQSGDVVRFPNTWTHWGNEAKFGMSFAEREPLCHRYPHGPYSMAGPVEVVDAKPGDGCRGDGSGAPND
jgi:hypothetical protein